MPDSFIKTVTSAWPVIKFIAGLLLIAFTLGRGYQDFFPGGTPSKNTMNDAVITQMKGDIEKEMVSADNATLMRVTAVETNITYMKETLTRIERKLDAQQLSRR